MLNDNIFYSNILQQHFINLGYTDVTPYANLAEYFDKLTPQPDIIFFDHGIDFLKGLEVLKAIKSSNADIYVIFMCGPDDIETVIQSFKYGAFDYFVKGENDAKNIETILTKIDRIQELLQTNNRMRFKKYIK